MVLMLPTGLPRRRGDPAAVLFIIYNYKVVAYKLVVLWFGITAVKVPTNL